MIIKSSAVLVAISFIGCADVATPSSPWSTPERDIEDEAPEQAGPAERDPAPQPSTRPGHKLAVPESTGCEEGPRVDEPNFGNDVARCAPAMQESYGADGCVDERWTRICEAGNVTEELYELIDPGAIPPAYFIPQSYYHVWTFDDRGQLVREARSQSRGVEPFFVETREWNDEGALVRRTRQNDPLFPSSETTVDERWEYHDSGEVLNYTLSSGDWTEGYRNVFDGAGRLVETWRSRGEGEFLELQNRWQGDLLVQAQRWDAAGLWTTTEYERAADGALLRKLETNHRNAWLDEWAYDEDERVVLHTQDTGIDGRIDYRETKGYRPDGLETLHRVEYDFDGRGVAQSVTEERTSYDDEGRPVELWAWAPWHEDLVHRTTWSYDADVTTVTLEELNSDHHVVRTASITRFDLEDRVLEARHDLDRDGRLEWVERNSYDADGNLVETTQDVDGDGTPDVVATYAYDLAGQLVTHLRDDDGDGRANYRLEARY